MRKCKECGAYLDPEEHCECERKESVQNEENNMYFNFGGTAAGDYGFALRERYALCTDGLRY